MLLVHPRSFRASAYDITDGTGAQIASIELTPRRDGATVRQAENVFRIERELPGAWQMWSGEELLYEARRPPLIEDRYLTVVTGASLEIAPDGPFLRRFKIVGPDWVEFGTLKRTGWLGKRIVSDLDDLIPLNAQLFLIVQAIVISRRLDVG